MISETIIDILRIVKNGNYFSLKHYRNTDSCNKILRILGNGKSLHDHNLNSGDNVAYMVVNRHVIDETYVIIKPEHYVLADPYFFNTKEGNDILEKIDQYTNWRMNLYMPNAINKKKTNKIFRNSNIKIVYYNSSVIRGPEFIKNFLYKKALAMPLVQNVLVAAIMNGILNGYTTIELYGVEHSWTKYLSVGDDNIVYIEDAHCYDKEQVKPRPFVSYDQSIRWTFGFVLECYSKMFKSYEEINNFIMKMKLKTKIINKTKGSFIDSFERE